jgi:hypothetical protein
MGNFLLKSAAAESYLGGFNLEIKDNITLQA